MYVKVNTLFVVFLEKTKETQLQSSCFSADLIVKLFQHPLLEHICREIGFTPFAPVCSYILSCLEFKMLITNQA